MGVKKGYEHSFFKGYNVFSPYILLTSLPSVEGCEHRHFASFLACLELFEVGFLVVLAFKSVQIYRCA